MISRRDTLALGGGALAVLSGVGAEAAEAAAYQPEDFFRPRTTSDVDLSPNGDRVAVLHADKTGDLLKSYLDIIDLAHPGAPPRRIPMGNHEASSVSWANERRLLVWVTYNVAPKGMAAEYIRRVISIQDDGTHPVLLFENRGNAVFYVHDLGMLIDDLPDDPDNVLMMAFDTSKGTPTLYRVDVNSGAATVVEYGAPRTLQWFTQGGLPMVRIDGSSDESVVKVLARPPGAAEWKLVRALRIDQTRDFLLFGAAAEPGVFFVNARMEGEENIAVRRLDLNTLQYGPPLLPRADEDARRVALNHHNALLWVQYATDQPSYAFADPGMPAQLKAMESYFGPECGIDLMGMNKAETRYVGRATGPRQPGVFFLYDRPSHKITELGTSRANLAPERLGAMEILNVRTRDGRMITAYLTAPASKAPGPLIVLPHGGPEMRDYFGYNEWVQTLAAQGWWVLQPNFRGSNGYGLAFAKAGWTHWGDLMQDDVTDAALQAIAEKKLDRTRVAIMGASFGGYAALMGPLRQPDLYRAAVSIAGVSDLPDFLAWTKRNDDSADDFGVKFWTKRIGDPATDMAKLIQASPRRRAAELKMPVMIVHGFNDRIVPLDQARNMVAALKAAGHPCEYLEVKRVGHPDWPESQQVDLMNRCVAFLAKALA